MLPNALELAFQKLASDIRDLNDRLTRIAIQRERSEVAGGVASVTVANLPTNNNTGGDLYWASNGRKSGEGVGAGTGVLVVWNPATSSWLRTTDYTTVVA